MLAGYHTLVQRLPCSEALGSFLRQQLSMLLVDLLELEVAQMIAEGKAISRNGFQQEQALPLAFGSVSLKRPRLRGAAVAPGDFLKAVRSRQGFHHVPYLILLGLARQSLGALQAYLSLSEPLWRAAECRFWERLRQWRAAGLSSFEQHCLVLETIDFGEDAPRLLVALTIDRLGEAQLLELRPALKASASEWSALCESLKQRSLPAPILVKGVVEVARCHWPLATALEV